MRPLVPLVIVTSACSLALGVIGGYGYGQSHPPVGKMLVPVAPGRPADLPHWACSEIVELRIESLNWRRAVLRSAIEREPVPRGIIEHYATAGGACDR